METCALVHRGKEEEEILTASSEAELMETVYIRLLH